MTSKKRLHVILDAIFFESKHAGRYFCSYFQEFCKGFHRFCPDFHELCPDFRQMNTFGGAPATLLPTPLTADASLRLKNFCFVANYSKPVLQSETEVEEKAALHLRQDDNMLVCGRCERDFSLLEVHGKLTCLGFFFICLLFGLLELISCAGKVCFRRYTSPVF